MESYLNKFDGIATIYDGLAHFMFAGSIKRSQLEFLDTIKRNDNVLILGGGTGWIIPELFRRSSPLHVYYIEASQKMIDLTWQRCAALPVTVIHGTESNIPPDIKFDVIIASFYLDVFSNSTLRDVLKTLRKSLGENAKWLVSDFVKNKWWYRVLLSVMYRFFALTTGLKTTSLPDWKRALDVIGTRVRSKKFFGGFIESHVYQC